ncbi:DUF3606 domain-containing protein [Pedobacter miscanthi]|uniref:DUF3606 domain-containing protein n=1 Tax=Pedobacter miscanthi TaxID=2259170 RepID=UPI00292FB632|nr:DUF3606 domain-containing protein [Pedobacter miscanthi]
MPWYNGDYPPSYKNQPLQLREKAVEIANALLQEGVEEGIAIATGLKRAREHFEKEGQAKESRDTPQRASLPDTDRAIDRHEIESDGDTLEPQEFGANTGTINLNDPDELAYWAEQFQISTVELKAAALLRGDSIAEIKKYLSM